MSIMKTRKHIALGFMAILLASAAAMPAHAKAVTVKQIPFANESLSANLDVAPMAETVTKLAQRKISASEAKVIALKRAGGGEVVDISQKGNTYRVRVIRKDGRVIDVLIDARTGRVK